MDQSQIMIAANIRNNQFATCCKLKDFDCRCLTFEFKKQMKEEIGHWASDLLNNRLLDTSYLQSKSFNNGNTTTIIFAGNRSIFSGYESYIHNNQCRTRNEVRRRQLREVHELHRWDAVFDTLTCTSLVHNLVSITMLIPVAFCQIGRWYTLPRVW